MNAWLNLIACGKINLDDVLRQDEEMKKQEILKQHRYPISYGKGDNRWHTYRTTPDPMVASPLPKGIRKI